MYRAVNVIFLVFLTNILIAQSKGELLQSDESQKKWIRKAVLAVEPVAIDNLNISAPVIKCPPKSVECTPVGVFNYTLTTNDISMMTSQLYDWLITSRYDRIIIGGKTAEITTLNSKSCVEIPVMPEFKKSDLKDFSDHLEKYGESVDRILNLSLNSRYIELPEKEQETFMVTKAKETGLALEFVSVIMNSAYMFGVKVNGINATGTIKEISGGSSTGLSVPGADIASSAASKLKNAGSGFSVSFQIDIKADILIYKYDPEKKKFIHYKTVPARSGGFLLNMLGLGAGALNAKVFPYQPGLQSEEMRSAWHSSFKTSVKALGISGNYELKKDDNFSIFAAVKDVDGSSIYADCGVSEDIRVDHPMIIQEYRDGKVVQKGFVKARKTGVNCKDRTATTRFRRIKGSAEEGDQLREHPWTGFMFTFGGGVKDYRISFLKDGLEMGVGGITGGGQFGFSLDMGYATNLRFFSETWLSFGGYLYGGGGKSPDYYNYPFTGGFFLNLSHRIHFTGGGAFIAPQLGMSFGGGSASADSKNTMKGDLKFQSLFVELGLQLGFSFNPNAEMILYGGYQFPVYNKLSIEDTEITKSSNASFDHGFIAGLNFQFHLPVVGATAVLYSKPSKTCRKTASESNKKEPDGENYCFPQQKDVVKDESNPVIPGNDFKLRSDTIDPPPPYDERIAQGINLLDIDSEILVAYDNAVKVERRENVHESPEDAIDSWGILVKKNGFNPFKQIGESRLILWLAYYKTKHEAEERYIKAKDNLVKMMPLNSISFEQKRDAAVQFVEIYGINKGMKDTVSLLLTTGPKEVADSIIKDEKFSGISRQVFFVRCEKGFGEDCFVFSGMVPKGSFEHIKYLKKSCELGYSAGCEELEILLKK